MKKVSKTDAAYIAGFFDGEGCISGNYIRISQKFPSILFWIINKLGFGKLLSKHPTQSVYYMDIGNRQNQIVFMKLIYPYSIVKLPQLKIELSRRVYSKLNRGHSKSTQQAYVAGFFDAEGCVNTHKRQGSSAYNVRIHIGQKYPEVLRYIKKIFKVGVVRKSSTLPSWRFWVTGQEDILRFISFIVAYSKVKREQLKLGLELVKLVGPLEGKFLTTEVCDERLQLHKKIKNLKHIRLTREQIHMTTALLWGQRSTCKRLKVGCVITTSDMKRILSIGYNGSPTPMSNDSCKNTEGNCQCLHAEQNAIAMVDGTIPDKVAFITTYPCLSCANLLVQANITKVFYCKDYRNHIGIERLKECNITVIKMDYPV